MGTDYTETLRQLGAAQCNAAYFLHLKKTGDKGYREWLAKRRKLEQEVERMKREQENLGLSDNELPTESCGGLPKYHNKAVTTAPSISPQPESRAAA